MELKIKDLLGNSFDTMYDVEPSMMICTPALDPTEPIQSYTDLTLNAKLNAVSELNLCVHKVTETGATNPCYGLIEKRKYIYMEGIGYFRITDCSEENSGDDDIKKIITAESKEAELGNINVPDLGTTDYKTGATSYTLKFYNSDHDEDDATKLNDCVIRRIQSALIGWTFDLNRLTKTKARAQSAYTFGTSDGGQESIGENIYNFLTTTVADAFEVIFLFDTLNSKIIPVYRDEYYEKTSLFFDRENIVESSRRSEKEGTFCTCLELSPNEDLIPYLNMVNPTGKYLYDFSYYWKHDGWMDQNLKDAIMLWEAKVKAQGDGSSDPQVSRCLEAWIAAKSMNEKARENSDLYHQQYIALTAAQGSETQEQVRDAINSMANLDSDVINRAAIKRENGENVSYASINDGLKNINILENLSNALGFNSDYRSYFKEASIEATNYNIVSNDDGVGELVECDRLIFSFRCTSLPEISNEPVPVQISLSFNGISVSNPDVYSVRKILSSGAIDSNSSDIVINELSNRAQINKVNEANEYYEIEWAIGAINTVTDSEDPPNYVKSVEIYSNTHDPNTPNVKLQFSPNQGTLSNFILSDASFEANASNYYTYVNSDFVMDSTMKKTDANVYGYHIWTPAFRVFNNALDPDYIDPISSSDLSEKTNIIVQLDSNNKPYYADFDQQSALNPWLLVYFNEVDGEVIKRDDIAAASWDYTSFPDDLIEDNNSGTSSISVTGYKIRLHFYGYVKLGETWTFKKLNIEQSNNSYLELPFDGSLPSVPFTFPGILKADLPKYGNFTYGGSTKYTEVQYIRIEAFTGDANIFNTLTILDPNLNYNAQNTDLLSFNSGGKLYPENYFDGRTEDEDNHGNHILRPPYSKVFPYITTLEYTNDNIIVLDTDDMAKREELALEFISEAKKQFKQNNSPVMECTVDSGAEIFSRDYTPIRDELALGSFCQVEFDTDDYSELPLEEISINWQECNFSMTFGTFRKKGSRWADLISQTISNQKSMDVKTTKLYSYVLDDTLGSVSEALTNGQITTDILDITSNPNNYTRKYSITNGGITLSSKDSDGNTYEVLIADGTVACAKVNAGGMREATTALGKYVVGGQTQWGLYGGAIIAQTITADKIKAGEITANEIAGDTITADKIHTGEIGGWTIDSNKMFHSITSNNYIDALISAGGVQSVQGYSIPSVGINSSSKTWKLLFGGLTGSGGTMNYTFGVDSNGNLYAQNADISGTINASSGSFSGTITTGSGSTIGGWTITDHSIENTQTVTSSNIAMVSLISDGKLTSRISGGGRTLIGNFICDNDHQGTTGSYIDLPNYAKANADTHTWQILTGENNTLRFGVTMDGQVYGKGFHNTAGYLSSVLWDTNQQSTISYIPPAVSKTGVIIDRALATLIGNFQQFDSDGGVTFPNNGTGGETTRAQWQILVGKNNIYQFGIDEDGIPYLPSDFRINNTTFSSIKTDLETAIGNKQDKLVAGPYISIYEDSADSNKLKIKATYSNATDSTDGLMSSSDKLLLDTMSNVFGLEALERASTAAFEYSSSGVVVFSVGTGSASGKLGFLHINMKRTNTTDNIGMGEFARFVKNTPVYLRGVAEQIFNVRSVEGHTFQIKIPGNSNGDIYIARTDGRMGQDTPHTIVCNIPYVIS